MSYSWDYPPSEPTEREIIHLKNVKEDTYGQGETVNTAAKGMYNGVPQKTSFWAKSVGYALSIFIRRIECKEGNQTHLRYRFKPGDPHR